MEIISSATKRKKRKTRKRLDEIRNRSKNRRDEFSKVLNIGLISKIGTSNDVTKSEKSLVTLNRLTLAMFPKAVRSETITRSNITENKQKTKLTESEYTNISMALSSSSGGESIKVLINKNLVHSNNTMRSINKSVNYQNNRDDAYNANEKISHSNHEEHSSDSLMFSPMNWTRNDNMSSITPSSQSSQDYYGYHIYEELMAEIPVYLKENTSTLIKEDVIKRTRALLHKLYLESCHQECEDNVIKCIRGNDSSKALTYTCTETSVQNPMEWSIRHEYEWRKNTLDVHESASEHSSQSLELQSSLEPLEPATPPRMAVMHDTPEYSYYPHILNQ